MGRMPALREALERRYGRGNAERICSTNALRLLERHWLRRPC
jgi:microsomal dipeptidase-like Zn-dependent dipeptidase